MTALSPSVQSLYCAGAGTSHLYLRKIAGPACVSIYHEVVSPPSRESASGRCIKMLDVTVANSVAVARIVSELFPAKPVKVIPFLTADGPLEPPPKRNPVGDRELRVTFLGRLVAQKRADILVKEWSRLSDESPLRPARLDVYGGSDERKVLHELQQSCMTRVKRRKSAYTEVMRWMHYRRYCLSPTLSCCLALGKGFRSFWSKQCNMVFPL